MRSVQHHVELRRLGNQLPVLGNQLPVLGNQLPVLGNQLPVLGNQLPVLGKANSLCEVVTTRDISDSETVYQSRVNSVPELEFLANSKSNSRIGIELAWPSPGGIGIELELPSFELELDTELPSMELTSEGPHISVAYYIASS